MADITILKETVIRKLVNKELTPSEASKLLNLSTRQVRRLKVKFQHNHSLKHGLKDQPGNRSVNYELNHYGMKFHRFNVTAIKLLATLVSIYYHPSFLSILII